MSGLIANAKNGIVTTASTLDSTFLALGDASKTSIPVKPSSSPTTDECETKLRSRIKKIEKEILPKIPGETSQQKLSWLENQNKKLERIIHRGRCEKKLGRPMPHSGNMVCLDEKGEDCTKTRVAIQYDYHRGLKIFQHDCKPRLAPSKK